ncbi:MAG: hypothetical protein LBS41_02790 [Streptococcaceae bacterium]|jgi:hypothetical protein|nr:hypothetical protein [Streptococcaceae bacterium]
MLFLSSCSGKAKKNWEQSVLTDSQPESTVSLKSTGYGFKLQGTGDQEAVHIVTAEESGNYTVECLYVPKRSDFETYQDYGDLMVYITVFPDGNKYDIAGDTDKAIFDGTLTSRQYLNDVKNHGYDEIMTETSCRISEGNQIMVLNGTVKFTKN